MKPNRTYSTFGGAVLTVSMNWFNRLVGVVSVAILARLLMPEDFGVIAMASLIVALADTILDLGVHVPLIQRQDATQAHYDSAWTLRLLQTSASTIVLFLAAPYAADYFQDDRVELVAQCLALSLFLSGLENIGVVDFQKKMQFGAEFKFRFWRRMAGFVVTIVLAYLMRSYWALVIGMLTERFAGALLSYWLHPMRPKIAFSKFNEIFRVSQWLLVYSIGRFLKLKLNRILVGRWESTGTMGAYSIAGELAMMPTSAVLAPVNRALFPAFAKAQSSPEKLRELYLLAQGVQTLITVPAAVGLALVAEEVVLLLMGANWTEAVPFVEVLSLISIAQALTTSGMYVSLTLAKQRVNAFLVWGQVILFCAIAVSPLIDRTAMDIAWLSLVVAMVGLWLQLWVVTRIVSGLAMRDIFAVSIRPLLATTAMAAILTLLPDIDAFPIVWLLLGKLVIGAGAFLLASGLLWVIAGKPQGAETYILEKLNQVRRTLRNSSRKDGNLRA